MKKQTKEERMQDLREAIAMTKGFLTNLSTPSLQCLYISCIEGYEKELKELEGE